MFGEEKERQTNDTVKFHEGSQQDHKGCPEVFLFANKTVTQQDDGRNGDVKLLHLDCVEQLVGTEPEDEYLLVFGKHVMADSHIQE